MDAGAQGRCSALLPFGRLPNTSRTRNAALNPAPLETRASFVGWGFETTCKRPSVFNQLDCVKGGDARQTDYFHKHIK
jgi:hypothetical protein